MLPNVATVCAVLSKALALTFVPAFRCCVSHLVTVVALALKALASSNLALPFSFSLVLQGPKLANLTVVTLLGLRAVSGEVSWLAAVEALTASFALKLIVR